MKNRNLLPGAEVLYISLLKLAENNVVEMDIQELEEVVKIERHTLSRHIKKLVEVGYISRERGYYRRKQRIIILRPEAL